VLILTDIFLRVGFWVFSTPANVTNGTVRFNKCKQLLEYHQLLLFRDTRVQCYKTFLNIMYFVLRLGRKSLPGTNTIAYYKSSQYTDKNILITLGPGCLSYCLYLTPVLIRHLWQLKTVVFLHQCLKCAVLFHSSDEDKFDDTG
jgi:hypothetical protein